MGGLKTTWSDGRVAETDRDLLEVVQTMGRAETYLAGKADLDRRVIVRLLAQRKRVRCWAFIAGLWAGWAITKAFEFI